MGSPYNRHPASLGFWLPSQASCCREARGGREEQVPDRASRGRCCPTERLPSSGTHLWTPSLCAPLKMVSEVLSFREMALADCRGLGMSKVPLWMMALATKSKNALKWHFFEVAEHLDATGNQDKSVYRFPLQRGSLQHGVGCAQLSAPWWPTEEHPLSEEYCIFLGIVSLRIFAVEHVSAILYVFLRCELFAEVLLRSRNIIAYSVVWQNAENPTISSQLFNVSVSSLNAFAQISLLSYGDWHLLL